LNQKNELDQQSSDPKRLLIKRSSTKLLQEEKLRNTIVRELPNLEKKLIVALEQWSSRFVNTPFIYKGVDYLKLLNEENAEEERKKQETKEQKERQRHERLGLNHDATSFRTPPPRPIPKQRNGPQSFAVPLKPSRTPQYIKRHNDTSKMATPTQASRMTKQISARTERTPTPRPLRVQNSNQLDKQENSTSNAEQKANV